MSEKKYWLMKSEPTTFSFQALVKSPGKTTSWTGVRNYQARNFMRDLFKFGDAVIFYHSSCNEPAAVGLAEVVKEAYKEVDDWVTVDIQAKKEFKFPVTRERMRKDKRLKDVMVLKKGSRLSIQPLLPKEFDAICDLGSSE